MPYSPTRGLTFARLGIAKAVGRTTAEQIELARRRWGARSPVVDVLKAAASGHESTDADFDASDASEAAAEFADLAGPLTLLDRAGFVTVPSNTPFIAAIASGAASWIERGRAIPVSRTALSRASMRPKTVGTLQVYSRESLAADDARLEAVVLRGMLRNVPRAVDAALIDPTNTGDDATPASLTATAATATATGDLGDDLAALLADFAGDLTTCVLIGHPRTAVQAAILAAAGGLASDLGARGGTLAGIRVLTSESVPFDSSGGLWVMVDTAQVAMVDGGYQIRRAESASVEMDSAPSGGTIAPATAGNGTAWVSLYQEDALGLLVLRYVNWTLARPDACVVMSAVDYSAV